MTIATLRRMFYLSLILCFLLGACAPAAIPQTISVSIHADGEDVVKTVEAGQTVSDILKAADISLGPIDKVRPQSTQILLENSAITITRVVVQKDYQTEALLPDDDGHQRVLQTTYQLTYEDGVLIDQKDIEREVIYAIEPDPGVTLVQGDPVTADWLKSRRTTFYSDQSHTIKTGDDDIILLYVADTGYGARAFILYPNVEVHLNKVEAFQFSIKAPLTAQIWELAKTYNSGCWWPLKTNPDKEINTFTFLCKG